MAVKNLNNRVLIYPNEGNLLVCSDLHGNKRDYLQMLNIFESELEKLDDTHLLFLGDLIHGPNENSNFNYSDESEFIVDHLIKMQEIYGDKIHSLLGNHEHGHVGGPHTPKFHKDEVEFLENLIGENKTKRYHKLFNHFPLFAITPTGIVFSHGAPSVNVNKLDEIINAEYSGHSKKSMSSMYDVQVLDMLWLRGSSDENAKRFLEVTSFEDIENKLLIYGHDVVEEGYYKEGPHHMILSTSFRVEDPNKTYLKINLSNTYNSTEELNEGQELLYLWKMGRKIDYSLFNQFLKHEKFSEAESFLDNVSDRSFQYSLNQGKLNLEYYKKSNDKNHLNNAIKYLEKSLTIEYRIAETHFLLADSYEKIADKSDERERKVTFYNKSISHFNQVDTYGPTLFFEAQSGPSRIKNKIDELFNLIQLY